MKFRHSVGNRIVLALLIAGAGPVVVTAIILGADPGQALGIVLVSMLLIGLTSLFLTRSIVSALRRLMADTERLARGELGHRAAVASPDEIGTMAQAFNDMAQGLENSQARLLATQEEMAANYEKLKETSDRLDRLWEVSTSLTATTELDQLLPKVGQAIVQLTQAPVAWVVLSENLHGQSPRQAIAFSSPEDRPETDDSALDDSLVSRVIKTKSPLVVEDLTSGEQGSDLGKLGKLPQIVGVHSLVAMPIISGDHAIGVLAYGQAATGPPPERERELVDIITSQVAIAIKNASLFEELRLLSNTDFLTRIYNHRYMMQHLDAEIARAQRYGHPLSVLMLDLDNFKRYNDSYGHLAGDAKLKSVASILKDICRINDVVGRYGGDEFVSILPETGPFEAEVVAQRLRHHLAASAAQDLVPVTISIGIATFPLDGDDRQTLIAQADAALYAAKGRGGNLVLHSHPAFGQLLIQRPDLDPLKQLMLMLDHDDFLKSHTQRVVSYALALARRQGFPREEQEALDIAARLHDIGRLGIPNEIWDKPGPLTETERRIVEKHPELGAIVSRQASQQEDILRAVRHHHERYDGSGYPSHLQRGQIPRLARLLAVADAYAAMIFPRPYRPALSRQEAIADLRRGAGSQFDPEMVQAFIEMLEEGEPSILQVLPEEPPSPGGERSTT